MQVQVYQPQDVKKYTKRKLRLSPFGLGIGLGAAPVNVSAPSFNGNFASLFSGVVQSIQGDLGNTLGSTLLHSAGTGPAITITGSLTGSVVGFIITVPATGGALGVWQGLVTYTDGTTQAFTSAATVALTGKGAGVTLNIAAGTASTSDVWKLTSAGLADQSGAGVDTTQATLANQPLITAGLNGHCGVTFDGSNDLLTYSLLLSGSAAFYGVARLFSVGGGITSICTDSNGASNPGNSVIGISGKLYAYANGAATQTGVTPSSGTYYRIYAEFSGASSKFWVGSNKQTYTLPGGSVVSRAFGAAPGATNALNFELLSWTTMTTMPSAGQLATADAAVTTFYGASVQL